MQTPTSIPRFSGSEKLYREQAAFHAYSDVLGPPDEFTWLWSNDAPAPKRRLIRRRGRSAKKFRETNGARFVKRLRTYIASGRPLTPPMKAALAALGAIDTNCSSDCVGRPAFFDGVRLPLHEKGEVIRIAATEGAETRQPEHMVSVTRISPDFLNRAQKEIEVAIEAALASRPFSLRGSVSRACKGFWQWLRHS